MTSVVRDRAELLAVRSQAKREANRRLVVRATFLLFFVFLIEGSLRKWFLPGLSGVLTLLRDPLALALYAYALANGFFWKRGVAKLWLFFAVLTSTIGLLQYLLNGLGVAGWLLGVRTYWLYMPLALVIAATYQREDISRFLRIVLIVAIPYAILVAMQYSAPPVAVINWGVAGDNEGAVGLGDGLVRPFGLFTYTAPNVLYTAFSLAAFIAYYLAASLGKKQTLFLVAVAVAVGTMLVLTGSRTIYFLAAAIFGLASVGILGARPTVRAFRRMFGILLFIGLAGVLFVWVFSDMFAAMQDRFERASNAEGGLWNRIYYNSFSFLGSENESELLGYGIGAGAPGVTSFFGLRPLFLGESDTRRNINELGLFIGPLFLLLRFATAGWIAWLSVRLAARREYAALPIAGLVAVSFAFGQLTSSTTEAYMLWLAFGLVVALRHSLIRET
ncbi:hypothetical protein [Rhodovulum marinum]|uniref:O-antigen ligase-like membrane protein n=1 Tax=Rhodovulum marinum TaxID=320662 RepID=A0A4R2PVZ5_9RHOB|nr:hypothetical protein [Rhodovulum marinum]TCP39298.1 hypothetical protein EV662_11375 [Rhodovulum marinum]